MILKCLTDKFPDRITRGKLYPVVFTDVWGNKLPQIVQNGYCSIIDDNKKIATVNLGKKEYFIDIEEWREQQIKIIIKNSMSHLEGYNQYLVSNANTLLNYIQENNVEYNTSNLVELIDNINNSLGDKLDFYAEQLDRTIAMAQLDFGYVHSREHNSVH
jgi:hypothetical protein